MNTTNEFINSLDNNAYVFSYGGSGTNYSLRILHFNEDTEETTEKTEETKKDLTEYEKKIKKERYIKVINIIHNRKPQNIDRENFIGIFIFSNPILSTHSIFRRKLPNVINLLSKRNAIREVYEDKDSELTPDKIYKSQSPQRSLRQMLEKYHNFDFLNLNEHFDNWINAEVNYPIIYINYDSLNKNTLQEIFTLLKTKYNVKYNQQVIDNFKPRNKLILPDNIYKHLEELYEPLIKKIESLPVYWIKNPIK